MEKNADMAMDEANCAHRFWRALGDLVSFATVSSQPDELQFANCAEYLYGLITPLGFKGSWRREGGLPLGIFTRTVDPDRPAVLIYQHYDVYPAGEESAWKSDPFRATFSQSRLFGRGAQDNKGQLCYVLSALADLIEKGELSSNIILILDGEEEIGSPSFPRVLSEFNLGRVKSLWSFDGMRSSEREVSFVLGCRGFSAFRLRIRTALRPLHSGYYGGVAPNAAAILMKVLSTLKPARTPHAKPDFLPLCKVRTPEEIRAEGLLMGLKESSPAKIFKNSALSEALEITALSSGTTDSSLNIPCEASATIVLRPAPGVDVEARSAEIFKAIRSLMPPYVQFGIERLGGTVSGFMTHDGALIERLSYSTAAALPEVNATLTIDGGCNPGIAHLAKLYDVPACITGTGLPADAVHLPNESYSFQQFELGALLTRQIIKDSEKISEDEKSSFKG